jgi:hypothetical protein
LTQLRPAFAAFFALRQAFQLCEKTVFVMQHATNPLPTRKPQQNSNQGQACSQNDGGRHAGQIMRANVAQDEEPIDHALATIALFSIVDAAASDDPSERTEIYDSSATCHIPPYIDAFTDFEFIAPKPISATDNRTFKAIGRGNL